MHHATKNLPALHSHKICCRLQGLRYCTSMQNFVLLQEASPVSSNISSWTDGTSISLCAVCLVPCYRRLHFDSTADLEVPSLKKPSFCSVVVVATVRGADLGHGCRSLQSTFVACTSAFLNFAGENSRSLAVTGLGMRLLQEPCWCNAAPPEGPG